MNSLQFLVYALGAVCVLAGRKLGRQKHLNRLWAIPLVALAIPCAAYSLYYAHIWEEPVWLYNLRALPGSELLASPGGILAGWVHARLRCERWISWMLVVCLLVLWLAVPYLKQLGNPLPQDWLHEKWRDGVCLQSTASTCGPASAATLLRQLGRNATEAELANESFSTMSGTENWNLKRAIERHGVKCRYVWSGPRPDVLPHPAIAGVRLGPGMGHFIAIIGETAEHYVIGEPLRGRLTLSKSKLHSSGYEFTGFFLVLSAVGEE